MAAPRLYQPPNVQLAVLLQESRRRGVPFMDAWIDAVRPGKALVMTNTHAAPAGAIRWPTDRTDRQAWQAAIYASADGWRRAYERVPPSIPELAIGVLADAIGALADVSHLRAVSEGIGVGGRVESAA